MSLLTITFTFEGTDDGEYPYTNSEYETIVGAVSGIGGYDVEFEVEEDRPEVKQSRSLKPKKR